MADKLGRSRTRNFACVVYPESAPKDWQERLVQQFVPAFISPLHDQDVNPTGEPKKPHHHVILLFDSVKTTEQAQEVFDAIGGVGCEVVKSLRAYTRYLCHLDNPDKVQYSMDDVRQLGGADFYSICECSIDRYTAIAEILDFCDDNHVYSFRELLRLCRMEHFEWFRSLCDGGCYIIKEYLKTASWEDGQRNYAADALEMMKQDEERERKRQQREETNGKM